LLDTRLVDPGSTLIHVDAYGPRIIAKFLLLFTLPVDKKIMPFLVMQSFVGPSYNTAT